MAVVAANADGSLSAFGETTVFLHHHCRRCILDRLVSLSLSNPSIGRDRRGPDVDAVLGVSLAEPLSL